LRRAKFAAEDIRLFANVVACMHAESQKRGADHTA
jgi:hypothetical protein